MIRGNMRNPPYNQILREIADNIYGGHLDDLYRDQEESNTDEALLTYQDAFSAGEDEDKTTFEVDLRVIRLAKGSPVDGPNSLNFVAVNGVLMIPDVQLIVDKLCERCTK